MGNDRTFNPWGPKVRWKDQYDRVWEYTLNPDLVDWILFSKADDEVERKVREDYKDRLMRRPADDDDQDWPPRGGEILNVDMMRRVQRLTASEPEPTCIPLQDRGTPTGWHELFAYTIGGEQVVTDAQLVGTVNDSPPETCIKLRDCTLWCEGPH